MEFKKLEIEKEGTWLGRLIRSAHFKKSVIFILLGAAIGFALTWINAESGINQIVVKDLYANIFTGAFIGFFLTNSPCARNKC